MRKRAASEEVTDSPADKQVGRKTDHDNDADAREEHLSALTYQECHDKGSHENTEPRCPRC